SCSHQRYSEEMKKIALLTLILFAAAGRSYAAADTAPKPLETKTKSSFAMETGSRNPFWPIGWKPVAKLAETGTDHVGGPEIPVTAFIVTSITMESSGRYAIINGKIMQEGQQFGLQLGNQTYQITLKAIQDGKVVLARRDQEIVVPMRRK